MTQEQQRVCEALDWRVIASEDEIELEKYSPAGEDFIFSITDMDDIPHAVWEYADDFDVDEHIEMWILARRSGIGTTRRFRRRSTSIMPSSTCLPISPGTRAMIT